MNIFDAVPSNFFIIFTSTNKEIYYDCLKIIYQMYNSHYGFDLTKDEVVESILEYFETVDTELLPEEGVAITKKERANYIIQKLSDCGWISIETDNNYVDLVNFKVHALTVMEALLKICNDEWNESDDKSQSIFEYRGYLFSIHSLLTNKDTKEYGLMIKQVYSLATEFVGEIKRINLKLKNYIEKISSQKEIKDLMDLLIDYKTQLIDKSYQRLKTYDNIDRYKKRIVDELEKMSNDEMIMTLVKAEYQLTYGMSYEEANFKALKDIDEIMDIFNGLDALIDDIELKNKIYVNSTITKVKFLLNNETDILGKLNHILKYVKDHFNESDKKLEKMLSPLFSICKHEALSEESLYTPKINYREFVPVSVVSGEKPDLEELNRIFMQEYDLMYSEDKIIKYVLDCLSVKPVMLASEIFKNAPTEESLIRLLYILVYASNSDTYQITKIKKNYEANDFVVNDFEITRRVN